MTMAECLTSNDRSLHPETGFAMTYSREVERAAFRRAFNFQTLTVIARRLRDEAICNS